MKVRFTEKFYSEKQRGKQKNLPIVIAKALIKSGDAVEVKTRQKKS